MKQTIKLLFLLLLSTFVIACSSEEPMTEADINSGREAEATKAAVEVDEKKAERVARLKEIAPEGTIVDDIVPEQGHDDVIQYPWGGLPPTGGVHHNSWQKCGIYSQPVFAHHAIHALEHGAVWITYHPDLDQESLDTLKGKMKKSHMLLSPYYDQEAPIVVTAWGLQLIPDGANDKRIDQFIQTFRNGLQTLEPGATCATGVELIADSEEGEASQPVNAVTMDDIEEEVVEEESEEVVEEDAVEVESE